MGDGSDAADIDRLMLSPEGGAYLACLRNSVLARRIEDVDFVNETHAIKVVLHLSGGTTFVAYPPELDIAVLRDSFGEAIERERQLTSQASQSINPSAQFIDKYKT